jgi:hypothetical protein
MIKLYDKDTQALIGTISKTDLQFLREQLEEEGLEDQDYAITALLLDVWEGEGDAPAALVEALRKALGDRQEMSIRWEEA